MSGLRPSTSSGPRPRRSVTPGRNASRKTSASSTRRSTVSTPAGDFRSTAMERRPRSHEEYGFAVRSAGAGTSATRSTRITSAPISASRRLPYGRAPRPANSRMRTSLSGPAMRSPITRWHVAPSVGDRCGSSGARKPKRPARCRSCRSHRRRARRRGLAGWRCGLGNVR